MITASISEKILTIGPDPEGKGGMSSVLKYYRDSLFSTWNFIAESHVGGGKVSKLFDFFGACVKLVNTLRLHPEIRVVHLHTAGKVSFPRSCVFMNLAKAMGRKVVMHIHSGMFHKYCEGREDKIGAKLAKADAVIALSEKWKGYYTGTLGLTNVCFVPNIVSAPPAGFSREAGEADGVVHALFLGNLVDDKGIYDLLKAIAKAKDRLAGKFVLHVGGKGDTARFESEIARLGIDTLVKYEGWVSPEKKAELLALSSVSILPSYFEGLPISLLEGMSYSHAVISTNVGGIPEILDPTNGVMHTPGDVEALSAAIVGLVGDRTRMREMGRMSYRKVECHLPENVGRVLTDLYSGLI